jgi:hypothetical protein
VSPESPSRSRWRPRLRGLHRDVGYLCVGLTIVYAVSGLAVNHIADWDPNFVAYERTLALAAPLPASDDPDADAEAATRAVLAQLEIREQPLDVFLHGGELEIVLANREIFVDGSAGTILDRGREPRAGLRLANWLHLNRGKKAWTVVADAYAVLLLFLAGSGMLMLPGRNGMRGRGLVLVGLGVLGPALYVWLSGGPG